MKEWHIIVAYTIFLILISFYPIAYVIGSSKGHYIANINIPIIEEKYILKDFSGDLKRTFSMNVSCYPQHQPYIMPLHADCPGKSKPYAINSNGMLCFGDDGGVSGKGEMGCKNIDAHGPVSASLSFIYSDRGFCNNTCYSMVYLSPANIPYGGFEIKNATVLYPLWPRVLFNNEYIILLAKSNSSEFPAYSDTSRILFSLMPYLMASSLLNIWRILRIFLGFITTALVAAYYAKEGKENDKTVPETISFVPNPSRKPWLVNMVFADPVGMKTIDAIAATLLDLHRRGKLKIRGKRGDAIIELVDDSNLDQFEQIIARVLRKKGGKSSISEMFDTGKGEILFNELMNYGKNKTRKFMKQKFGHIAIALASILFSFIPGPGTDTNLLASMSIIQAAAIASIPPRIMGRWKEWAMKEYLQWQAFKRFLEKNVSIGKYGIEDISVWDEWLVYGTALGIGKNVMNAMSRISNKKNSAKLGYELFLSIEKSTRNYRNSR